MGKIQEVVLLIDKGRESSPPTGNLALETPTIRDEDGELSFTVVWTPDTSENTQSYGNSQCKEASILETETSQNLCTSTYFFHLIECLELPMAHLGDQHESA